MSASFACTKAHSQLEPNCVERDEMQWSALAQGHSKKADGTTVTSKPVVPGRVCMRTGFVSAGRHRRGGEKLRGRSYA